MSARSKLSFLGDSNGTYFTVCSANYGDRGNFMAKKLMWNSAVSNVFLNAHKYDFDFHLFLGFFISSNFSLSIWDTLKRNLLKKIFLASSQVGYVNNTGQKSWHCHLLNVD